MMKKTYLMPQLHTVKVKRMAVLAGSETSFSLKSTNASTNSNSNEYSNALAPGSSGSDGEDW